MVKVLVVAALCSVCATQAAVGALFEETPVEFANRFYRAYGTLRVRGIPNERQRHALAPFLSPELLGLCARTDRWQHAAGNGIPPEPKRPGLRSTDGEGDLFTSNSAGCAVTYAIAFPRPAMGRLILPIRLADPDSGDAWVDELVLHRGAGGWVIADIIFTHDRQNRLFGRGSLRRALGECLRRTQRHGSPGG